MEMNGQGPIQPCSTAGVASAEKGHVVLDGPGGVAITMTAEAAARTAASLIAAAHEAKSFVSGESGEESSP